MAPVTTYFAFHTEQGIQGVFRQVKDDEAQTLTLERPDGDGVWVDDPELIDELAEPGVSEITPEEAAQALGFAAP